jgi:hypothetical protein
MFTETDHIEGGVLYLRDIDIYLYTYIHIYIYVYVHIYTYILYDADDVYLNRLHQKASN